MSEPAVSLAFFDPGRELHCTARRGATLLFRGAEATAVGRGPDVAPAGDGYRATLPDAFELEWEAASEAVDLGGASTRVCRVTGTADGRPLDCMGTATETVVPPAWAELDAVRALSAVFNAEHAVLAVARRPRGAPGHGLEQVRAWLLSNGEALAVEDARVSTVYDAEARQRSAGMELWLPGEDFPRRVSGSVLAGASLTLEGLRVETAVFEWRMDGRAGCGAYDVAVRDEPPAAA